MSRPRRPNFTAQEKVAILREVLLERQPVSGVCERHRLQPGQLHSWQKQLLENGAAAFGRDRLELECEPLALAFALTERAAECGIPVAAAFWTERLLEQLGESRHHLGAVRRFLIRLHEAPGDRRLSLIDRLAALEWGVT